MLRPSLAQHLPTNDHELRYQKRPMDLFPDPMKATVVSCRGNQDAQVYAAPNEWTKAYPIKLQSQAHKTFSLLCARDGVLSALMMDGAHEQTMGEFWHKCHQVGIHVQEAEPYTPFSMAAEGTICELKVFVIK
jgi:hypothetical protein